MPRFAALFAMLLTLAACAREDTYPLSEEQCTAQDPVQELTIDCTVLPTGTGTF